MPQTVYIARSAKLALIFGLMFCLVGVSNWAQARPNIHPEFPTYFAPSNGMSIAYQEFGDPANETILLVMGLGAQLIHWNDDLVLRLVDQGFHVIRFDNRDVGLSEKLYDQGEPGLFTMLRYQLGLDLAAPYTLNDMAADAIGLLDYLNIEQAHVVGASMGGMIAQIMAAEYPERVLSLGSIMSTTSAKHLPEGAHKVEMRDRDDMIREQIVQQIADISKIIYAKEGSRTDADWLASAARSYDRSHYDPGFARQVWAVLASGDRVEMLQKLTQPTVVIHGTLDPLLPIEHGRHTAELVPNSLWVELEDMGHYIYNEHHERVVTALVDNIARVKQ